jgi:hypothetical protein
MCFLIAYEARYSVYIFFNICRNVKKDVIHAYGINDPHNTYVNLSKPVLYMYMGWTFIRVVYFEVFVDFQGGTSSSK